MSDERFAHSPYAIDEDVDEYPAEDGKPLAETEIHLDEVFALLALLRRFFKGRDDVYVASNHFIYYTEGKPHDRIAPDIYVVFGVKKIKRRVFKLWEEKKSPSVVFEISSRKTLREDLGRKKKTYAMLGVKEYFLFDPENKCLKPALQAYELVRNAYRAMTPEKDGSIVSSVLGLRFQPSGDRLDAFQAKTDEALTRYDEIEDRDKKKLAEVEAAAATVKARLAQAEAETARLREELERLKETMTLVEMPRANENLTEATLDRWLVPEGANVTETQPLCEIITDKAKFELPSPAAGVLLKRCAPERAVLPVGYVLCVLGAAGEAIPADVEKKNEALLAAHKGMVTQAGPAPSAVDPAAMSGASGVRATPAARRVAKELGVDLAAVAKALNLTGPVNEKDVRAYFDQKK